MCIDKAQTQYLNFNFLLTSFILTFLLLLSSSLAAQLDQNGWQMIEQNDFIAAEKVFKNQLKANSTDADALCGLIFIAETIQDYANYKKYTTDLIESDQDEAYMALFGHMYEARPEKILGYNIPEALKISAQFELADSLFGEKRFKDSEKAFREVIGDYEWSVIGPFPNVAGSGFLEEEKIETEPFRVDKVYQNEYKMDLKWNKRILRDPNGVVDFQSVLPSASEGAYYANTFLDFPSNRELEIRMARSAPVKIWLDGNLVFEEKTNIAYNWDHETISVDISKGIHRLLVKMAPYSEGGSDSKISLNYNDQEDNGDGGYRSYYDSYSEGGGYRGYFMQPMFALRMTDDKGKLYKDISSSFTGEYSSISYEPEVKRLWLIDHFKKVIDANPKKASNYFLLAKAYLLYGNNELGEAYFSKLLEAHPDELFFKYLMAKFYARNNKGEKAEELISEMEEGKTPIFALMRTRLSEIDVEKNEEEYLATLDKLLHVSPTNWGVINSYLDHFSKKGMNTEKKQFIKDFLAKFPDKKYKKRLDPYLEDDSYKPSSYKPQTDKEREKEAKKALKRMKKKFKPSDYFTVIDHYKQIEKTDGVIKMYDELIKRYPYYTWYRTQKAKFLFEKDKEDAALIELNKVLEINPYSAASYETIGDIYFEKEKKQKAKEYYEKAKTLNKGQNSYGGAGLDDKIEKIENKESLKEYFQSISFEEALADDGWKDKYTDEESVILLYTVEGGLDRDNVLDYNQKILIKIQNEAGAKYWTEANFSFMGEISTAKVIKKDGKITSPSRNYGYVVFKNLEAGDIIQIEGNSKGDMTREIPGEMYHIASVSFDAPLYKSRVEYIIPKEKPFKYQCYRVACTPEIREVKDYTVYEWNFNEVKKMKKEEAVKDNLDSYSWFMYSTQEDWSEVVKWYLRKTYRRLETNYEIMDELQTVVNDQMSDKDKVTAIYNHLTKEITYSHVSFLNSNYIPKKPSATISDQIGDCKDVASLMIAMLREVGIESHYVLVRGGNFTNEEPMASIAAFNHVIVGYVLGDGIMRYLDMTTDYYPHYVLPQFDANSWALLVKEGETNVFRLPDHGLDQNQSRFDIKMKGKVNPNRSLDMTVSYEGSGVLGGTLREQLNRVTTEVDRKKYLKEYFGEGAFDHLTLTDFSFENLDDITIPLKGSLKMKAFNHVEKVSDFYIIQIPVMKGITTRPALFAEERYNNLDLSYLFELTPAFQEIELEIPSDFQLMEMPKDIKIDNKYGSYNLRFEQMNTGLRIKRDMIFKTSLVEYEEYDAFKAFYLEVLDYDRMKLAIRKR